MTPFKRCARPDFLASETVRKHCDELCRNCAPDGRPSGAVGDYWRDPSVKHALYLMQSGKCAYCERARDEKLELDVEHFRPKNAVHGEASHPGYWWLANEWENLLLACGRCNRTLKGTKFPLEEGSPRAARPTDDLREERPMLLNPSCEDVPFVWSMVPSRKGTPARVVPTVGIDDPRADHTINFFKLKAFDLAEARAKNWIKLKLIIDAYKHAKSALAEFRRATAGRAGPSVDDDLRDMKREANRIKSRMKSFLQSSTEYTGMMRHLAETELPDEFEELMSEVEVEVETEAKRSGT